MVQITSLNAHGAPPEAVRLRYKQYMKTSLADIDADARIVDLQSLNPDDLPSDIVLQRRLNTKDLQPAFDNFVSVSGQAGQVPESIPVFTHRSVTG